MNKHFSQDTERTLARLRAELRSTEDESERAEITKELEIVIDADFVLFQIHLVSPLASLALLQTRRHASAARAAGALVRKLTAEHRSLVGQLV